MNNVVRSRKQLGRGLSSLMADDSADEVKQSPLSPGSTAVAAISSLEANPDQPRKTFVEEDKHIEAASTLLYLVVLRFFSYNPTTKRKSIWIPTIHLERVQ